MQQSEIEELVALNWVAQVARDDDGQVVLTVEGLSDFAVCGSTVEDVTEQFEEALRSHLKGYLATGKVVPVPAAGRIVADEPVTGGNSAWDYVGFDAATGRSRRSDPIAA